MKRSVVERAEAEIYSDLPHKLSIAERVDAVILAELPYKLRCDFTESAPQWVLEAWLQRNVKPDDWGLYTVNTETTFYFKHEADAVLFALKWIGNGKSSSKD